MPITVLLPSSTMMDLTTTYGFLSQILLTTLIIIDGLLKLCKFTRIILSHSFSPRVSTPTWMLPIKIVTWMDKQNRCTYLIINFDLISFATAGRSVHPELTSGGAWQISLISLRLDFYPYHLASSDRAHWWKYTDTTPHFQWLSEAQANFKSELIQVSSGLFLA